MKPPSPELVELCGAVCDEIATPQQVARLEELLKQDSEALQFYIRFTQVGGLLERYEQPSLRLVMPEPAAAVRAHPVKPRGRRNHWLALAASVALLAALYFAARPDSPRAVSLVGTAAPMAVIQDADACSLIPRIGPQTRVGGGQYIRPGEILATSAGGGAVLRLLNEETLFILTPNTRIWFAQDGRANLMHVDDGQVFCDVAPQKAGSQWRIITAQGETTVLGTRLAVNAAPDGTNVAVTSGRVRVTARDTLDSVEARAGFEVRLTRANATLIPLPLSEPTRVVSFSVVNADTGEAIAEFEPLTDGAVINLAALTTPRISLRANCEPQVVSAVRFALSGIDAAGQPLQLSHPETPAFPHHTEMSYPYFAAGDPRRRGYGPVLPPFPWTPPAGRYTLTATPYAGKYGSGARGIPLTVNFEIIDRATPN